MSAQNYNYDHILEDGRLEKLDVEIYVDPNRINPRLPRENPSFITKFTPEMVLENLNEAAIAARELYDRTFNSRI